MTETQNALLAAALRYATGGWPVFPCHWTTAAGCSCGRQCAGPGKHPLPAHGVLEASTDFDQISAWWSRWPAANVAIATGAPGPDVVDVDVKAGAPGAVSFERLRTAGLLAGAFAVVTTPSGGWHLYYAGTDQGNGSISRHGVDFRGHGGYVLAPPSTVGAGAYELAEYRTMTGATVDWQAIRHYLDPPRPVSPSRAVPGNHDDHDALIRWMGDRTEGGRNNGLYWAARRALETGADGQVLDELVRAAVSTGLSEVEAVRTVRSARDKQGVSR